MGRITIKDLPKDMKISKSTLRKIYGGVETFASGMQVTPKSSGTTSPVWFGSGTSGSSSGTTPVSGGTGSDTDWTSYSLDIKVSGNEEGGSLPGLGGDS